MSTERREPERCDCVGEVSESGRCPMHGFGDLIYRKTARYLERHRAAAALAGRSDVGLTV